MALPGRQARRRVIMAGGVWLVVAAAGCQYLLDRTDRQVYSLIEQRQQEALGQTSDSKIARGDASVRPGQSAYAFVPRRVSPEVPEDFRRAASSQPATGAAEEGARGEGTMGEPIAASGPTSTSLAAEGELAREAEPGEGGEAPRFALRDCLRYAFVHARDFQQAKEDLYLTALDLTLERYLWTPTWVAGIQSQYDYVREYDRAMQAVAQAAVQQRLPYGGEVAARVIDTLVRDLGQHVTTTESAKAVLEATLPLLRGAGKAAYESRYQAERDLVYAVRTFERFRRGFAVDVASDYFTLLELRQRIINAQQNAASSHDNYLRAKAMFDAGRAIALDVQRAYQNELTARNGVLDAQEGFESSLDQFKVTLGMPLDQPLELAAEEVELVVPDVSEARAVDVAVRSRLDVLTSLDRIDDAKRGISVARNGLLPDLELRGSVALETESDILDLTLTENNRTSWQGVANLDLPLDRKQELNRYRSSLVSLRRAERDYELAGDRTRQQVRQALRRIDQTRGTLAIQRIGMELAEKRRAFAQLSFEEGTVDNREVVDAQTALLDAQNAYASAQSRFRVAILAFRRDTETLRVEDEGNFLE